MDPAPSMSIHCPAAHATLRRAFAARCYGGSPDLRRPAPGAQAAGHEGTVFECMLMRMKKNRNRQCPAEWNYDAMSPSKRGPERNEMCGPFNGYTPCSSTRHRGVHWRYENIMVEFPFMTISTIRCSGSEHGEMVFECILMRIDERD